MQNSSTYYSQLTVKNLDVNILSEVEKLKLKNCRPKPDIAITQECTSRGIKFII